MGCSASPRLCARPKSFRLVWPSRERIPRASQSLPLRQDSGQALNMLKGQAQSLSRTVRRNWLDDGWLGEVRVIRLVGHAG
jgi:hypothetical protein